MPLYDDFLQKALASGYDQSAVEAEIRRAIPSALLKARQSKIPLEKMRGVLNRIGLPEHLWRDPTKALPESGFAPSEAKMPGSVQQQEFMRGPSGRVDPTEFLQGLASIAGLPGRGTRGIGVGAAKLIGGAPPAEALARAAEATKPSYAPRGIAEYLGTIGGGLTDPAFVALVTAMGPVAAAARGGIIAKSAVQVGLPSGFMAALQEMAANGEVNPEDVAVVGAVGTVLGAGVSAAAPVIGKVVSAVERMMPAIENRIASEIASVKFRFKKAAGIPQETGLVPFDIKQAVVEGRMSLKEAARQATGKAKEDLLGKLRRQYVFAGGEEPKPSPGEARPRVLKTTGEGLPPAEAPAVKPLKPTAVEPSPIAPPAPASPLAAPKTLPPELAPAPVEKGPALPREPTPRAVPKVDISMTATGTPLDVLAYQGRGASLEEIYGKEAVELGRAYPIAGKGEYYTLTEADAAFYGTVSTKQVRLENPYVLDNDTDFRKLLKDANALHLSSVDRLFYEDPKGIPAAAERLQAHLRSRGHDGLVVRLMPRAEGDLTRRMGEAFSHSQIIKFAESVQPSPVLETPPIVAPKVPTTAQPPLSVGIKVNITRGPEKGGAGEIIALFKNQPKTVRVRVEGKGERNIAIRNLSPIPEAKPVVAAAPPAVAPIIIKPKTVEIIAKERKAAALAKIDAALKIAKPEAEAEAGIVEVKIDGGVKIANTKEALTDFRARLNALPERVTLSPQFKPQKLTYTAARQERFGPLLPLKQAGWFSDGHIVIKDAAPARAKPAAGRGEGDIAGVLQRAEAAKPANLLYYYVENSGVEGVSPMPIDKGVGEVRAVFQIGDKFAIYDQLYITGIINRYPDATWAIAEDGLLAARKGKETVAALMPLRQATGSVLGSTPPLAEDAIEAGLYKPVPGVQASAIEPIVQAPADFFGKSTFSVPEEPPVVTEGDQRRAFATFLNEKVDIIRAREILTDLFSKIGGKGISFQEKTGALFGRLKPGTMEIMVNSIDNIATLAHEIFHGVDKAMGTLHHLDKQFPLSAKVGQAGTPGLEDTLRSELLAASMHVRPFYPKEGQVASYKHWSGYRKSHPELFADWGVMFAADPQLARRTAPTFTNLWLKKLEAHPDIKAALEPFLGAESSLLKASFGDRSPKDIAKDVLEWAKGVELDPTVRDTTTRWRDYPRQLTERLVNLFSLPFWKGQRDPRRGALFNIVQGSIYRTERLENAGLRVSKRDEFMRLPAASKSRIANALFFGNDKPIQKYFTPDELARHPFYLTQPEIKSYGHLVQGWKYARDLLVKLYKERIAFDKLSPEAQSAREAEIIEGIEKLGGYVKIHREGDYVVFGRPAEEGDPYFDFEMSKGDAKQTANALASAGYGDVRIYDRKNIPPEFWKQYGGKLSAYELELLVEASGANRNDPNIQALLGTAKTLRFKDMVHRKWIPGFKKTPENLVAGLEATIASLSRQLAKYEARRASGAILNGRFNPKTEAVAYQDAARYIDDFFSASADEFYWLRQGLYNWHLAFKLAFFLQNVTQPLLNTWPEIARFRKKFGAPEALMAQAYSDLGRIMKASFGKGKLDLSHLASAEAYIIRRLTQEGVISGTLTQEILAERQSGAFTTQKVLGFLGHYSEQINRLQTAIAAARIASEDLKLNKEESLAFVRQFIHKTQFAFGKANIPSIVAGSGRLSGAAKVPLTFRNYWLNQLERMVGQLGPEFDPDVVGRQWAALLGLSGISGAPFALLLFWAMRKFAGVDIPVEVRRKFKESRIADVILGGVPALAGIDTRRMLGIGDIINAPRVGQGTLEAAAEFVGGAALGAVSKLGRALDLLRRGEAVRATEMVTPSAIANIIRANRIYQEGLRGPSGRVYIEKPAMRDIVYTALGMPPLAFSKIYERDEKIRQLKQDVKDRAFPYIERIAKAIFEKNMKEAHRLWDEVRAANEAARKAGKPEEMIRVTPLAIKRRILEMKSERLGPRLKYEPKQVRRAELELEDLYE